MAKVILKVTLDLPEIEENVLFALDAANFDMDIEQEIEDSVESTINDRVDTFANEVDDIYHVEVLTEEVGEVVDDIKERLDISFDLSY